MFVHETVSNTSDYEWFKQFKEGHESIGDDQLSAGHQLASLQETMLGFLK